MGAAGCEVGYRLGMAVLAIRGLTKSFPLPGGGVVRVLDVPEFRLDEGEQVALAGGSGTGKTTLLNILAGILPADSGSVEVVGRDLTQLSEAERDLHRANEIGYVFQTFHLLDGYTALENVLLGMTFGPGEDPAHARELLERLGLGDRMDYVPGRLSVGQRQRVAVARALANRPRLVLADEPTGNLDARNAEEALHLMRSACRDVGASLLVVSHDPRVLADFDRVVELKELNRVHGADAEA